jgi:hypothetical protein
VGSTETTLEVPSRWGRPALYRYSRRDAGSDRLAIIFPGYAYGLDAPALWFAARAAAEAGCDALGIEYGFQANRANMTREEQPQAVAEAAGALAGLLAEHPYPHIIVIAKSIGTVIATRMAEAGQVQADAHVFLTPLRPTIPFMKRAARLTVVVGDRDELFGPDDIAQLAGLSVHVMAGAGHTLEVEGDVQRSVAVLAETAALCRAACG